MAAAVDILMDENSNILFENGDFKIGHSDFLHVKYLLLFEKGTVKNSPLTGCALRRKLNTKTAAADILKMRKEVRLQLTADGYRVQQVSIVNSQFKVDYERI